MKHRPNRGKSGRSETTRPDPVCEADLGENAAESNAAEIALKALIEQLREGGILKRHAWAGLVLRMMNTARDSQGVPRMAFNDLTALILCNGDTKRLADLQQWIWSVFEHFDLTENALICAGIYPVECAPPSAPDPASDWGTPQ